MTRHLSMSMFASKEDLQAARISQLEADNAALMEAVRRAVDYDPGLRSYTPFIDALPAHLKEEASK